MYFLFDTVHNALKVPGLGDVDGPGKYPRAALVLAAVAVCLHFEFHYHVD